MQSRRSQTDRQFFTKYVTYCWWQCIAVPNKKHWYMFFFLLCVKHPMIPSVKYDIMQITVHGDITFLSFRQWTAQAVITITSWHVTTLQTCESRNCETAELTTLLNSWRSIESKFGTFIGRFVVSHSMALNCGRHNRTGLGDCDKVAFDTLNIKNRAWGQFRNFVYWLNTVQYVPDKLYLTLCPSK
jgi:hypothetical protein